MKNITRLSGYSSIVKAGRDQRGSILVFLIALMVIFTVLGVGMVSMFGSSVLSVFGSNSARRANYLAESGLRYTISEVRNVAPSAQETAMTNVDDGSVAGKWFNVFPGVARYQVRVNPYWSKKTNPGTITILADTEADFEATVLNSGFPLDYAIPGVGAGGVARLFVGSNPLVAINSVVIAADRKMITYRLQAPATSNVIINSGDWTNLAFPTTNPSSPGTSQTVTKGSTATPLVLNINSVSAIPQKNGQFMDETSSLVYTYQSARVDSLTVPPTVKLENINWSYVPTTTTATFPENRYLIFLPVARLDSTGEQQQAQRVRTDYMTLTSTGPPQNYAPSALTEAMSGFTGTLGALDLSKSGDRVLVQGYIATGGTHAYWAAFQHLGEAGYSFEDPEEAGRYIGWHVAPISDAIGDNLQNSWMQYNTLSYDVQIKNGWDLNKERGGSGIAVRWHENPLFQGMVPPGNDPYRYYQGYGITYMIYMDDNHGSPDMIPNNIKPPGGSLNKRLLLVLWEQKVDAGGVPRKDWLAYALLGHPDHYDHPADGERHPADADQKVTGYQVWPDGRLNDNATIVARVEDKFVTTGGVTTRCNEIKVFYGDASEFTFEHDSRTQDRIATNKQRARYYPKWLETGDGGTLAPINPQWPSNQFGLNGSTIAYWYNDQTAYDYFSLTSSDPTAPYNTVTWVKNDHPRSGFNTFDLLNDDSTIRTTDFVLDSFASGRKEIGLVGMGDISGPNLTVAFDDFYIQILGGY